MDQSLTSEKLNFLHQLLDKELEGLKDSSLSNSEMRSHPIINPSEAPQLRSRLQSSGNNNNNNMLSDHNHLFQAAAGASSILESSLNVSSLHQRSDSLTSSKDNNNNSYFSQKFRQTSNNTFPEDLNSEMTFQAKGMMQFKQQLSEQQQQQQEQQQQQNAFKSQNESGERSARISSDLQELQNKIMKLEKKIVHINAGQQLNDDKENAFAGNTRSFDGYDRDIHRFQDKKHSEEDTSAVAAVVRTQGNNINNHNYETFSTLRDNEENGDDAGVIGQDIHSMKSNKVCYTLDTQERGDEDDTPLKQKYYESNKKRNAKRHTETDDDHNDSTLFHTEMSHQQHREQSQQQLKRQSGSLKRGRSSSAAKGQTTSSSSTTTSEKHHHHQSSNSINKYSLERKIEQAEGRLNSSKSSLKKTITSRNNSANGAGGVHSQRSSSGNSRKNSLGNNNHNNSSSTDGGIVHNGMIVGQNNYHNEVQILNKKLMQMKKQQDIDRENLIKERLRSNELQEEVDRLNRKMKRMANQIDKTTAIDEDYKKLMQSFEKSEFIRQQQKQLIVSLKAEIDSVRKVDPDRKRPKSRSKQA